tara:strand:- start:5387 stop:5632 length:246 start_codon:yes stop_codon:yes gene_type:complete
MTPEIAEQLKNSLTTLVEQDGGIIELVQFTNDSMEFNLLLDSAECAECVMAKQFLEEVFLAQAQTIYGNLRSVLINDPRKD